MENKRKTGREDGGKREGREDGMKGGEKGGTNGAVGKGVLINNSSLVQRNCCSLTKRDLVQSR